MEYYGNRLSISMRDLVDGGIVTEANYKKLVMRGRFEVVRRGGGAAGNYALVAVDSLPEPYRRKVEQVYPMDMRNRLKEWIISHYQVDEAANAYFFSPEKCGIELPAKKAQEYVINASVLNTCIRLYDQASTAQKIFGNRYDWEEMASTILILRNRFKHTLPSSMLRFRKKVNEYRREGYSCLISGKFGNQTSRKVTDKIEEVIVGISGLRNKPFNKTVHQMYLMFLYGELDVYDLTTGELFDYTEFRDKNDQPITLSETTINNYLNKPKNQLRIRHAQESYTTFMHEQMPHMHRHHGEYSLSKVSFDDRDLPRKLKDTRIRPKAYYAYDVTSGCCIGYAYNRSKNVDLVVDMFRNMFRLLDRHGWGCPAEVEVENHIMSKWSDSFLKAGVMFPFVRFCAPMNSQEKHSENFNGAKKRSIEHNRHYGIGRFYAKNYKYRTESVKVFDEYNDTYLDKEYYSWEELIADDLQDIIEYNNSPHWNQKKYKGKSKLDVFIENINPNLRPLDKATIARYVGEKVSTSVRRNSYCRVEGKDWWLSKTEVIEKLAPNNYNVDAHYLTDEKGNITDMYIFQNDMYIDKLEDVGTFCTARAEQTDKDREVFINQRKKISDFNRYVSENAIRSVGVMKRMTDAGVVEPEEVEAVAVADDAFEPETDDFIHDYARMGLDAL